MKKDNLKCQKCYLTENMKATDENANMFKNKY